MAIITITRAQYSGGETLAENIAKALGARCESDEVLREAAKTFNVPEADMSLFFEKSPSLWERMTKSRHVHAAYIRATLAGWCKDNNLVYHGNAGQELLREVPHALKTRLIFSQEHRVERVMELFGYTHDQAEKYVAVIDDDRTKRTRYYYDADWRDASRYDLVIQVDKVSADYTEQLILDMVKQPAFQLTKKKERAIRDFHLKSVLQALAATYLDGKAKLLAISVNDGNVLLEGDLPATQAMEVDELVDKIRALDGVKEVVNDIHAGLVVLKR